VLRGAGHACVCLARSLASRQPQESAGPKESSGEESPRPLFQVSRLFLMVSYLLVGHVGYCGSNDGDPLPSLLRGVQGGLSAIPE